MINFKKHLKAKVHSQFKVKLVAIAKDEAAYLPEWIHHHLYFGFDAIDIYINRTTDNSLEIINKIKKNNPNVRALSGDFVDLNADSVKKEIQRVIYSVAYENSKADYTHLLFLDIDEFWTPLSFNESIGDFLNKYKNPDVVSFEWSNKLNDSVQFANVFDTLNYVPSNTVKTIFKTDLDICQIGLHSHKFLSKTRHVLSDGTRYVRSQRSYQLLKKELSSLKGYFIYHRMYRSECEYLSMLLRGNPVTGENELKYNRPGYLGNDCITELLPINSSKLKKYKDLYSQFIDDNNISHELVTAQEKILLRSDRVVEVIQDMPSHSDENLTKVLNGITHKDINQILLERTVKKVKFIKTIASRSNVTDNELEFDCRFNKLLEAVSVIRDLSIDKDCYDKREHNMLNRLFNKDKNIIYKNASNFFKSKNKHLSNLFLSLSDFDS